jgi:DNA mismatch repair protein MutH
MTQLRPGPPPPPPDDLPSLMARARTLVGRTVGEIAVRAGLIPPRALGGHKGFVGQLVELALGAEGGSEARPDFPDLGVELKTLPVRADGTPVESTFVSKAVIDGSEPFTFAETALWAKLARVLFVPVEGDRAIPVADRRFGMPFLWEPGPEERAALERDWRHLSDRIRAGELGALTARDGVALQLRPKALDAREQRPGLGEDGWLVPTQPRGWYLRRTFTAGLVARAFF